MKKYNLGDGDFKLGEKLERGLKCLIFCINKFIYLSWISRMRKKGCTLGSLK